MGSRFPRPAIRLGRPGGAGGRRGHQIEAKVKGHLASHLQLLDSLDILPLQKLLRSIKIDDPDASSEEEEAEEVEVKKKAKSKRSSFPIPSQRPPGGL